MANVKKKYSKRKYLNKAKTNRRYSKNKYTRRKHTRRKNTRRKHTRRKKITKKKLRGGMDGDAAAFAGAFEGVEPEPEQDLDEPTVVSGRGMGGDAAAFAGAFEGVEPEPEQDLDEFTVVSGRDLEDVSREGVDQTDELFEDARELNIFEPGNLFIRGGADDSEFEVAEREQKCRVFSSGNEDIRERLLKMPDGTLFEYVKSREGSHNSSITNFLARIAAINVGIKKDGQIYPCRKNEDTGKYEKIVDAKPIEFNEGFIDKYHIKILNKDFKLETMLEDRRYIFSVMGREFPVNFNDFTHENLSLNKPNDGIRVGSSLVQKYVLNLGEGYPSLEFHWYNIAELIEKLRDKDFTSKYYAIEGCEERINEAIKIYDEYTESISLAKAGLVLEDFAAGVRSKTAETVSWGVGNVASAAAPFIPKVVADAGSAVAKSVGDMSAAMMDILPEWREEKNVKLSTIDEIVDPEKSTSTFILSLLLRLIRCGFLELVFEKLGVSTGGIQGSDIKKQNFALALIQRGVDSNALAEVQDTGMGVGRAAYYTADDFIMNILRKLDAKCTEKLLNEFKKELLADRMNKWKRSDSSHLKEYATVYTASAVASVAEYMQWEKTRFAAEVAKGVAEAKIKADISGFTNAANMAKRGIEGIDLTSHMNHIRSILGRALTSLGLFRTLRSAASFKIPEDFEDHIKASDEARDLYNSLCLELIDCTPDSEDKTGVQKRTAEIRRMLKLLKDHGDMSDTEREEFIKELMTYGQFTQNPQIQTIVESNAVQVLGGMGRDLAIQDGQEEVQSDVHIQDLQPEPELGEID